MTGLSVAERLQNLKLRIDEASMLALREPGSVRLLAVSKLQSLSQIREAMQAGQMDFAENYLQEVVEKQAPLAELKPRWHFIGRIQSNKVKALAGKFLTIHSVDRLAVAEPLNRLSQELNLVQDIFLQLNIADEAGKGGVAESDLEQLLTKVQNYANLRVLGLMVMPPLLADPEDVRPFFTRARELLEAMRERFGGRHPLNELSMGTSHDFEVAISEGATWVRIGSEIFGPREEKL